MYMYAKLLSCHLVYPLHFGEFLNPKFFLILVDFVKLSLNIKSCVSFHAVFCLGYKRVSNGRLIRLKNGPPRGDKKVPGGPTYFSSLESGFRQPESGYAELR